jgi:hypothetical protein
MFIGDALLNSQFIKITSLKEMSECESMLSMSIGGNRTDEDFKKILQYEENRNYDGKKGKILAMHLLIQFPRFSSFEEQQEFVNKFMCSFKQADGYMPYEHDIPYVFWHSKKSEGEYINILLCQRAIYEQPKIQVAVWKKNTWIDSTTGMFTTKGNPNAVLKEKGTSKYDKEGNPIFESILISPVKDRSFNYCSDSNNAVRNSKFKYFITGLKLKTQRIINSMCLVRSYLKGVKCTLKTEAFTRFDKKERKGKVLSYNSSIRTIRFSLGLIANDLSKKRKMMIQLSGAGGTKEAFAVQYKEYKSLVNKISSIFEQKRLTYTIRTKLKNAPKQAVYDFSFEECDLNLWEKKFYHVTQVVLGMIKKYQKAYLDELDISEELYQDSFRQAKERYEAQNIQ